MAQYSNSIVLWTDSLTEDVLTNYAEGFACAKFDNRVFMMLENNHIKFGMG